MLKYCFMAPYFRFNIPCATTSTTTTTTTLDLVTINLYADQEGVASNLDFHTSTDGGSTWNFVGASFNNTTCPGTPTVSFSVARNSSLMVRMGSTSNINAYYRSNRDTTTCPAFNDASAQCEWSILTNANRTFYHTTNVQDSTGCPDATTTTSTTTTTTSISPETTTSTTTTSTTPTPETTTTTTTTTTTSTTTTTTTAAPACFEYVATADQTDLDNSDNATVYFEYIDCNGNPQTEQRGTTTPGNPVCAQSVGNVYILIGGNQSTVFSSSWSGAGASCGGGGGGV